MAHAFAAGADIWSPVVQFLLGGGLILVLAGVFQRLLLRLLLGGSAERIL